MKRRVTLLLLVSALLLTAAIVWRWPASPPVTVSFLGYTNDYGGYSFGRFRVTNHTTSKSFVCYQGPIYAQIQGRWSKDTERLGRQHDPIIEPGSAIDVSVFTPIDASLWRSSFTLKRIRDGAPAAWRIKRMELFRKLGIKWFADEREYVATSETIKR